MGGWLQLTSPYRPTVPRDSGLRLVKDGSTVVERVASRLTMSADTWASFVILLLDL